MVAFLHKIKWFVGLVLLQVLILNHVHIYEYATPFFFIYFILDYRSGVKRNILLLWAFCLGLAIDIFSNTPGMNAAATTLLAFVRPTFLRLMTARSNTDEFDPGIRAMGLSAYFRYILLCTLLFCIVLLVMDTFSFFDPLVLALKVLTDASVTIVCILCAEAIRREK